MTHIEHLESIVNQFGDEMDKATWQQIREKLDADKKPVDPQMEIDTAFEP
jgi:hypothetical protein